MILSLRKGQQSQTGTSVGTQAAELLLSILETKKTISYQTITLKNELTVR
ncbi:MAG: hypothetical protein IPN87_18235 [Saprospiraceae bacterium]|nr:hypothetical protein [Candidatus Brachybacter algidus]